MLSLTAFSVPVWLALTAAAVSNVSHVRGEMSCTALDLLNAIGVHGRIQLSKSRMPFGIILSSRVYGKGDTIKVNITGPRGSRYVVQVRSIETNQPVGKFVNWPQSDLRQLSCGGSDASFLATIRPLNSTEVIFDWQSPHTDKGTLILTGTFFNDREYWMVYGPKIFHRLLRVKKELSMTDSTCYGADVNCLKRGCGYNISYSTDSQILTIQIDSTITRRIVSTVFAITNRAIQHLADGMVLACNHIPEVGVKVWNYTRSMEEDPVKFITPDMSGDTFRCVYRMSLEVLKGKGSAAQLKYTHFWIQSDEESEKLILSEDKRLITSFRPLLKEEFINVLCHPPISQSPSLSRGWLNTISVALLIVCLSLNC